MRPRLDYGMPACSPNLVADINHLERIQTLATKLVTGICHLPYEERLQWLGLHSLQRRRRQANLMAAFKILTGLLDVDANVIFFYLPLDAVLEGTPTRHYKVRATAKGGGDLFGEGCEILE